MPSGAGQAVVPVPGRESQEREFGEHMSTHHLAIDLGAESGRLMLGTLADGLLSLKEVHRFPTGATRAGESLHWDMARLFGEVSVGLRRAGAMGLPVASISTDSWGVDYLLLRGDGSVVEPTYHYRDPRTARGVEAAHARVSWPEIFAESGLQFMPLNTLYQLAAEDPKRLAEADRLLLVGDAFNHFLSGVAKAEVTLASTSMLYNPRTRRWSDLLRERLGLPMRLFPEIVPAGTRLGPLLPALAAELGGNRRVEVVATCSHDTGAAVAAVPADGEQGWAYLSSGTWSLMGVERPEPVLTETARELNFTNEIGFGNTVRLLKNISGLWLLQECRRTWAVEGGGESTAGAAELDYATLVRSASEAPAFASLINPADPRFLPPDNMPARIAAYCRDHGEPVPAGQGAMVRCILESLALLYRRTREQLEQITGERIQRLHIVGGGSRNDLLNQFAANALQVPVIAGPVEATAAGNLLVQAQALGLLGSLTEVRRVVRQSFQVTRFQPADGPAWDAAYARFRRLP